MFIWIVNIKNGSTIPEVTGIAVQKSRRKNWSVRAVARILYGTNEQEDE